MSTEAAATLSLEIDTKGAETKLIRLREEYERLQTALATTGTSTAGFSKISKELEEASRKITDLEGKLVGAGKESEAAIASLSAQVVKLNEQLASPERASAMAAATQDEKAYRTVVLESLKEQRAERTRSAAHIASYYQEVSKGARATGSAVKSMVEAMEMKPATLAGLSQYYGALEKSLPVLNKLKDSEVAWQSASNTRIQQAVAGITRQKEGLSDLAAHYKALEAIDRESSILGSVKNLREQEVAERASADARVKAASQGIQAKQKQEHEYTLWFAAELAKRDKEEASTAMRTAQLRSRLSSASSSRVATQVATLTAPSGASALAADYLASGAIQGGGNALATAEAAEKLAVATAAVGNAHGKATPSVLAHTNATKGFASAANEAHAFARGLSGSLGTLWMTYGSMVPLMAGAALAGGFMQAAKAGSEFAYQLTFVKALGGESAQSVAEIGTAALNLSKNSMYGPVELANGLRMLSQAGLTAAQSMEALPTVMNLATVGEMNMEQASLSLIGVMNAFGMSLQDLPHIGDMFSKAAALSQTSVAGMTEAMKAASVVHDQYGASVEDTATAIALLAKVNITGTAAGTSYRNMLKDLYTPSKEAAKTLEKLGVETKNANGSLREAPEILKDLKTKLQGFNQGSQTDILGKIFSERGGKEAIQMLGAVGAKWDELKNKISNSDGFMAGVTAELEMTTKGRFQQALNTMQTNLIKAFDQSEGSVRGLADSLRDLVDSPEFVQGLNGIVSSMAMLAKVAVDLAPALIRVGEAWLAFKTMGMVVSGVSLAINAFQGLSVMLPAVISATSLAGGGIAALGAEMVAASTATTALAGASGLGAVGGAIALLTNPITWLVAGIGAVALAAYNLKEGTPAGIVQVNNFNDVLDRQIAKLKEANAEMERKNRLQNTGSEIDRDAAQQNLETLRKERKALEARIAGRKNPANLSELDRNEAQNVADDVAIRKNKDAEIAQVQKLSELEKQQAQYDSSSLKNYIGQARQGLKDLKDDAANAKKSVNTAMVEAVIGQMEAGGLSSEGRRTAQRSLDRYMLEARQQMMGTGSNTYTSDPKGGTAALKDAHNAQLSEMKGFIQEQERMYTEFQQDTAKSRAAGDITELQALKANWDMRNQTLSAEIEKQKEIIAETSKGKNSQKATQEAQNALDKLESQQRVAQAAYNTEVVKSKTETNDEILKLEVSLGLKLETERDKALTVMKGQYAKALQEAVNNGDTELIEALGKIEAAYLKAADIKDQAKNISGGFNEMSVQITNLNTEISSLEAMAESDGGWLSRVFNAGKIQDIKDTQLPGLIAKLEDLKAQIAALPEGAQDTTEARELQKQAATTEAYITKIRNDVPKVWKDTVKKVDSIFHDGFTAMFSKGKTDWKAFGKSLADDFKTTVMDAIYQMLARPFVMNIVASVAGTVGVSGLAQAAGVEGSAGGVGGIGNMLSTGSSVYDAISGSAGSMYGNFATSGIGSALGLSTGLSTSLGVAGGAGSVMGGSAALAAAEATSAGAMGLTSLGASIGAALPVIVLAVAGISLLAGSLHKKTKDTGAVATSTNSGTGANTLNFTGTSADTFDAGMATGVAGINKSYFDTLNPLLAALGNKQVFSITSDQSAKKKGNGNQYAGFDIGVDGQKSTLQYGFGKVSDAEALAKATSSALGEGISHAISMSDLSEPIKKLFEGVVDQAVVGTMVAGLTKVGNASKELNDVWGISVSQAAEVALLTGQTQEGIAKTVDAIGTWATAQRTVGATLETAFASLDPVFTQLTNSALPDNLAAYDAAMKSVDTTVTGGIETFAALFAMREGFAQFRIAIDGLKTSASTAIDAFRTPEERLTLKQATLSDLSTKAGIAVPTSGAELVKLFDEIDFSKPTEAGMNLAAALPAIAAAFTDLQTASKTTATAINTLRDTLLEHFATAQTLDQAMQSVASGLTWSMESITNMSAADLNKNMTETITSADDAKLAIINGLLPALDQIKEHADAVAAERSGLQDELDSLTMTSTQLLLKQRDALDESNQALFDSVEAAKRSAAVATERSGLQDEFDSLTLTNTQLLNKQRAALDASNRSLFNQINAIKSAQAAMEAAKANLATANGDKESIRTEATNAYLSAVEKVASITETAASKMRDFGASLMALIADLTHSGAVSESASLAVSQAQFSRTLTLAKGGDESALGNIGAVGQQLIADYKLTATSSEEFQARQAEVLAGLRAAADVASAQGGAAPTSADELAAAIAEMVAAQTAAVSIGASLESSVQTLAERFAAADASAQAATAAIAAAQAVLDSIKKNTYDTNTSVQGLDFELDAAKIAANLSIETAIHATVTSSAIPQEIKDLALGVLGNLSKTIDVTIASSSLPDVLKSIGIGSANTAATIITATIQAASLTDPVMKQVISQQGAYVATISSVLASSMPVTTRELLSNAVTQANMAVSLSATLGSAITDDQRKLLDTSSTTISKIVQTAITGGYISPEQAALLNAQGGSISKTVAAIVTGGSLTDDQRKILNAVAGATSSTLTLSGNLTFDANNAELSLFKVMASSGALTVNVLASVHNAILMVHQRLVEGFKLTATTPAGINNALSVQQAQDATRVLTSAAYAQGGAFVNGVQAFAGGGSFRNSIVSTPTNFDMGLMGEAGPEAIMPLSRTSDGDLGVKVLMPFIPEASNDSGNADLVAELRALRTENQAQARALVQTNQRVAKLLERWDANGSPEVRNVA